MREGGRVRRGLGDGARTLLALAFVLPLWWMVVASLRPPGLPPPTTVEWVPRLDGLGNYAALARLIPIGRYLANSLWVELLAVPVTVVVASWAGFALLCARPRARRALIVLVVAVMLVPATALWLTRFLLFRQLGWIDSHLALAAPALAATQSFYVLLFYAAFRRIPRELFDAARLEGASPPVLWATLAMPLSRPATIAVAILAFCHYWSDLSGPLLYLKSEARYTLPVGIEMLRQMDSIHWPLMLAGCVVMIFPVLLLFLLLQRVLGLDGRVFDVFLRKKESHPS